VQLVNGDVIVDGERMAVGIDFGTTNSAVAIADGQGVRLVPLQGAPHWRTVLYFEPGGALSAGAPAIARYLETEGEGRLVQSIKSHLASAAFSRTHILGRKWTLDEVADLLGHASTKTTERYAHRLNEVLKRAAAGTGFHGVLTESANLRASFEIRTRDLRFTNPRTTSGFSGLALADFHERSTARDRRIGELIREAVPLAYRAGDRLAKARVTELLREGAELLEGRRVG